ncbi:unnamed protein product [Meganyctiphanes norvegica]|uniref:Uncharacterized protein n=1 Tax=Meganyctiphanes norvegica TaxID=48144 RepID=A0AAV2QNL4_MEGNR
MSRCAVNNCRNEGSFRIPRDPLIKKLWLSALRSEQLTYEELNDDNHRCNRIAVCPTHFKQDDFMSYDSQGVRYTKKVLRPGSVPTIFPWSNDNNHNAPNYNYRNDSYDDQNSYNESSNERASKRMRGLHDLPQEGESLLGQPPPMLPLAQGGGPAMMFGGENTVLLVLVDRMTYPVTLDTLQKVFSRFGRVLKIATFTKNNTFQAHIQFPDAEAAQNAKMNLTGRNIYNGCCTLRIEDSRLTNLNVKYNNDESRDYTNPNLPSGPSDALFPSPGNNSQQGLLPLPEGALPISRGQGLMDLPQNNAFPMMQGGGMPGGGMPGAGMLGGMPNMGHRGLMNLPDGMNSAPLGGGLMNQPPPGLNTNMSAAMARGDIRSRLSDQAPGRQGRNSRWNAPHPGPPGGLMGMGDGPGRLPMQDRMGGRGPPGGPMPNCVLLVSSLNQDKVTCDAIFTLFGVYGDVLRVKILFNKKDTAMVQMAEPRQVELAIHNLDKVTFWGKTIRVNQSKHQSVQMPRDNDSEAARYTKDYSNSPLHRFKKPGSKNYQNIFPPGPVLHLSNLPTDIDSRELEEAFTDAGATVVDFKFFDNRKMALIKLSSTEDAIEALIKMNNYQLDKKSYLRVSFSKSTF